MIQFNTSAANILFEAQGRALIGQGPWDGELISFFVIYFGMRYSALMNDNKAVTVGVLIVVIPDVTGEKADFIIHLLNQPSYVNVLNAASQWGR